MQIFVRLLVCHLALLIVFVGTWIIGFIVMIPVVSVLENHKALKIVGPAIAILLIIGGLCVYIYALYKIYHFSLVPFIVYATIPIITFVTIGYAFLKTVRFGW